MKIEKETTTKYNEYYCDICKERIYGDNTELKRLEDRIRQMNIENENIRKKQEKQNAHIKMQEEKIKEYKKQIEELKKEDVVWKPKENERFFYSTFRGNVFDATWDNDNADNEIYNMGNCFKTKEEAEKVVRHLKTRAKLQRIADRLNNGEKIDWKKSSQTKWFIYYDYDDNEIYVDCCYKNKSQGTIYCLYSSFKETAKKEIGKEELTAYLKGE